MNKRVVSGRAVVAAVFLGIGACALPAFAVDCPPGEPKFAYLDVGNDGCFNSGVDPQIPDVTLFSNYSPVGSIVIPAGVKATAPDGADVSWNATNLFLRGTVENVNSFSANGATIEISG